MKDVYSAHKNSLRRLHLWCLVGKGLGSGMPMPGPIEDEQKGDKGMPLFSSHALSQC